MENVKDTICAGQEVLRLDDVSYVYKGKYRQVRAVDHAKASFVTGKVYAICGKSGSGKTTLLSLLAGLDVPTEGDVLFEGKSTRCMNLDRYRRDDLSVIYQSYNLFPLLNVVENASYPLELRGVQTSVARSRAIEKLLAVGLKEEQFKSYPNMLSGGEQQRVAIARALIADPRIILADEPTGNLDVENGNIVTDILLELAHKLNYCVVIVTHDNAMANKADNILYMSDGRLSKIESALKVD